MVSSIGYLVGWNEHVTEYPFMDAEWPEEWSGDEVEDDAEWLMSFTLEDQILV